MAERVNPVMEELQKQAADVAQAMSEYADSYNDRITEAQLLSDEERAKKQAALELQRKEEQLQKQYAVNDSIGAWNVSKYDTDVSVEAHAKVYNEMQAAVLAERQALSGSTLAAYNVVNPETPAEEQKPTKNSYDLVCLGVDIAKAKEREKADLLNCVAVHGVFGRNVEAILTDIEHVQKLENALHFFQEADKRKKINL